MENNNQQGANIDSSVSTTFTMPPPSGLPVRTSGSAALTVRDLLAAQQQQQQQQQQQSPNLTFTGQQNVFQFSEDHFIKAEALAQSGTMQSPHQVCSPNIPSSPHVVVCNTETKTEMNPDFQSQINLLQTFKNIQGGKPLKINAADLIGMVGADKLQEALLSSSNLKPEVSITLPSQGNQSTRFQTMDNVSDVMYMASMLQEGDFDTNISMDEGLLGQVSTEGGNLVSQNSNNFDLFEGDSSMNEYGIEGHSELPLSPNAFGGEGRDSFNMSDPANTLATISLDQDNSNSGPSDNGASGVGPHQGSSPGSSASSTSTTPQTECHLTLKPPPPLTDKPRAKGRPAKAGGPGQRVGVSCQVCNKYFNNSSALAKHKLTHSDERKYVCNICSKAFKRQDHLNGHMMTHRSKKPFECNFEGCDKSYCDARSLRRHLENHHQAGLEASGEGLHDQYFHFDGQFRPHASSDADPQRSPSYLQQISPISPAPGCQPPSSPGHDGPWRPGYNPILDGPKPVQCTVCHRRFKNIPALNGHMRLHGGYFKKDGLPEESSEEKTSTPPSSTPQHGSPSPSQDVSQSYIEHSPSQQTSSLQSQQQQQLLMQIVEQQHRQQQQQQQLALEHQLSTAVKAETEVYGQPSLVMTNPANQAELQVPHQQQQNQHLSASQSAPELGMVHKQNYPPSSRLVMKARTSFQRRNQQLVLPSGNPISQNQLGYQGTPLNSPGPNSHPATPNHPLTPNHPQTPNHPLTPNHPPHTPQQPLTPHTPHTQPPTPQTAQHPQTPLTPHQPPTPHTPHTPGHTPITPNHHHHAQHFQFPPQPGLQESVSTSPFVLQQHQQQQHQQQHQQQQQQPQQVQQVQPQSQLSINLQQQVQEQQQQLQQLQLHELGLSDDQMQSNNPLQFHQQLSAQELEQQLQEQLQQQAEQHRQEVLQRQVEEFQHTLQQLKEQDQQQRLQQQQQQQQQQQSDPFDFEDALNSDPGGGGTQVNFDSVLENSLKSENSKLDVFFCKVRPQDTALHERKRRASADPDKFMQPKRPFNVGELLSNECASVNVKSSDHSKADLKEEATPPSSSSAESTTFLAPLPRDKPVEAGGVFRNPAPLPTNTLKARRKHRPEPLVIPPQMSNFGFPSRLRSPRLWEGPKPRTTPPPYTPPPMLSPLRSGSGLFWTLHSTYRPVTPKSAPIVPKILLKANSSGSSSHPLAVARPSSSDGEDDEEEEEPEDEEEPEVEDPPPETDILPHVNIGPQYQTELPELKENRLEALDEAERETLMWNPVIMDDLTEEELQYYQDFACCAAIPGNGCNKEYALHLLHLCKGAVKQAMLKLMQGDAKVPRDSMLHTYTYQESDVWSAEEIEAYHSAMVKCDKDFFNIANEIGSKTVKQCVQFYYLWKKVCADEYKRLRIVRRKREQEELYNLRSKAAVQQQAESQADKATSPHLSSSEDATFVCEYADCTATFTSKQALNGHIRIHGGGSRERERSPKPPPPLSPASITSEDNDTAGDTGFPCRICGRVFMKVKSRNAHMKSHRQVEPAVERARWSAMTVKEEHI